MKNLLKLHENLAIFPLNFSQDFNGFWFCSVVLAVFLLVACRRFFFFRLFHFASLYFISFAPYFTSLLPISVRFLSHHALLLFPLVVTFFVSCFFLFLPFSPLSLFTGLWVFFPLAHLSSFFAFFVMVLLRLCTPGFFVSFVSFRYRIICLCVQCLFCSVSCVFHFWPLLLFRGIRYISVLPVWPCGPPIVGLFVLVSSVCCS